MKKGFTLIELLAVIVVLAIIALIAVPVILNVIEKSKEGAAVDSAYGYIHAIEQGITMREIKDKVVVSNGDYTDLREFETINKIEVKGEKPISGIFTLEKRQVVHAELLIDKYLVVCDKKLCRLAEKKEIVTITYDANGGTLDKTRDKIIKNNSIDLPIPTKENYGFDGWYDGDTKVNNKTVFNKDVTLKAKYIKDSFTITLENAKFSDGDTVKALDRGTVVDIYALIPDDYIESNYSGNTSCSNTTDIGNIKYKNRHEYSVMKWNVSDSTDSSISYTVNGNATVKVELSEQITQVDNLECTSIDATHNDESYTCPNGGELSGTSCYTYTIYTGTCEKYCPWGGYIEPVAQKSCTIPFVDGNGNQQIGSSVYYCHWKCPSGGSPQSSDYNTTTGNCKKVASSYAATHVEAGYTCPDEYTLSGSICYKWTGV